MEKQKMGALIEGFIERPAIITSQKALVHSIWDMEHWRGNRLLSLSQDHNIVTNEGLDALLDIMFGATAKIATWYVIIFETDTTPVAGTTYGTPVFTETNAAYDEATRPEYIDVPSSGQSISNSASKATFTMNATKSIYGAALLGGGSAPTTKGDTAGGGTMYCAAQDRKSTRLNSSHTDISRMPSSA